MLTHNTTHNDVTDDIFRNAHAPARQCHVKVIILHPMQF
jgi:hypothetical protein